MNAGEPIDKDDPGGRGDLFGTAVNVATRIAAKAGGGEMLVSDVVHQLVAGKKVLFNNRGETELRGFRSTRCGCSKYGGARMSGGAASLD